MLRHGPEDVFGSISTREAEVLAAVGEHLSNAEIAARLFISVRTVESHVSSLLRKLQVDDRRGLAALARLPVAERDGAGSGRQLALPAPLTPFVGRVTERAALADALSGQRLVTAVGPGGVGKTRLALSVIDGVRDRYTDGTWFVDLTPISDPASVAPAIAGALGLGEHYARSAEQSLLDWFAARRTLLVLDNCEHLLEAVVVLIERLLAGSVGLTVLATSRSRLRASFEWVFQVPGLSVQTPDGEYGDAVELFVGRARAAGAMVVAEDLPRVAGICAYLDGMALSIELAAARLPSLGIDGLEAGLADPLDLLTGGPRLNDRHRSLRTALDWSYHLLDPGQQAVLRRISVFASRFTAEAAAEAFDGWAPVHGAAVAAALAGLADQSLVTAVADPNGTRYRVAEAIRQYAAEELDRSHEAAEAAERHLRWCLARVTGLAAAYEAGETGAWRAEVDRIGDDVRGALGWAAPRDDDRAVACELAGRWAELALLRGWLAESQRRHQQAAALAYDERAAAESLRRAAGAAECRHFGDQALGLLTAAAELAALAGDRDGAARDLARSAELMRRAPGLLATQPPSGAVEAALARAAEFVTDDPATQARLLVAEAFRGGTFDPLAAELAERAAALARRAGDVLTESAALDQLTSAELACGDLRQAAVTARHRLALLAPVPITAMSALEQADALSMSADTALAVGDIIGARQAADQLSRLPFHREGGHLATSRLLIVEVVAGRLDEAVALADCYRDGWHGAGRPRAGNLSRAAYAAATAFGLMGDDAGREEWLDIVRQVTAPGRRVADSYFGQFFDALLCLHRGEPDRAAGVLAALRERVRDCHSGVWRPWHAALRAEAAVLSDDPAKWQRVERARVLGSGNRVAEALVKRATALAERDHEALSRAATALDAAGCRYQWARTLTLLDGRARRRGETALALLGATPTEWPCRYRPDVLAEPA